MLFTLLFLITASNYPRPIEFSEGYKCFLFNFEQYQCVVQYEYGETIPTLQLKRGDILLSETPFCSKFYSVTRPSFQPYEFDVNGDGYKDLVWMHRPYPTGPQAFIMLYAIFLFDENGVAKSYEFYSFEEDITVFVQLDGRGSFEFVCNHQVNRSKRTYIREVFAFSGFDVVKVTDKYPSFQGLFEKKGHQLLEKRRESSEEQITFRLDFPTLDACDCCLGRNP